MTDHFEELRVACIYSGELFKSSQNSTDDRGRGGATSKPAVRFALEDRWMMANEVRMTWLTKPVYTLAGSHQLDMPG